MTGTVVEFLILLVAHAAAGIYSSTPRYNKRVTYLIWGGWIVLQGAVLWCAEFIFTNLALQFFFGFVLSIIGQYALFFLTTKGRLAQRIFTMLTYSVFFCIVIAFFSVIKGTFPNMPSYMSLIIQSGLLLAVVSYYLCYVCPMCRAAAKNITNGWQLLIFVNFVFLFMIILSSVFPAKLTGFHDPALATFLFLCTVIIAVYPVIFTSINSMSEASAKKAVEMQNRLLLTQIETENLQLAVDRQARHDRRHHNLVMLEFANNKDVESIRQYLQNLVDSEAEARSDIRYCDNRTVNTVLAVYERRARENDIPVKIAASVSHDIPVSPQDLVIVIANLFENAIHAAEKIKLKEKCIDVSIRESAQRLLIRVENPCKTGLAFDEALYGVGIRSIIATSEKYDGMYDFTADEGVFFAKVSLNLK